MFLRSTNRKKDGKDHRYFSVVENRRVCLAARRRSAPFSIWARSTINSRRRGARRWRYSTRQQQSLRTLSLFPDDREIPADAIDSLQVSLSGLELRRPRMFGNCWLACELWQQLGLDEFWRQRLAGRP